MSELRWNEELDERHDWDQQPNEPAKAHSAFRLYRDMPPHQRNIAKVAEQVDMSERRVRAWAQHWRWRQRADAWDEACHRIEDQERLEAIREMHSIHRQAGRAALGKAIAALKILSPNDMTPGVIARMLELGAKLERSTLLFSVEELQGIETQKEEELDPWEAIARELDPNRPVQHDEDQ